MGLAIAYIGENKSVIFTLTDENGMPISIPNDLNDIKVFIFLDGVEQSQKYNLDGGGGYQAIDVLTDNQFSITIDMKDFTEGLNSVRVDLHLKDGSAPESAVASLFQVKKGNL